jgi:hypothetical protein
LEGSDASSRDNVRSFTSDCDDESSTEDNPRSAVDPEGLWIEPFGTDVNCSGRVSASMKYGDGRPQSVCPSDESADPKPSEGIQ